MMERYSRLLLLLGIGAIAVVVALALVFVMFRGSSASAVPNPNGYDDLLRAAHIVVRSDPASLDHEQLRALVATNAEALRLLRLGLRGRCAVPTEAAITNFANVGTELIGLKWLAKMLAAEGQLAEMENRTADAAQSYTDVIHLGIEMSRGGLLIHRLVGIACEGIGGRPLAKLVSKLTSEQARPLLTQLEQIDETSVTWEEVARCENQFARIELAKYRNPAKLVTAWWEAREIMKNARKRHEMAAAHLRLITAEVALRCWVAEHRTPPARLELLVPEYLRRLPLDPFSRGALVYRSQAMSWVLYSIGPDRVDDGGKPMVSKSDLIGLSGSQSSGLNGKGDLFYDSPW
jgi:hypothetical protein